MKEREIYNCNNDIQRCLEEGRSGLGSCQQSDYWYRRARGQGDFKHGHYTRNGDRKLKLKSIKSFGVNTPVD
jgi:hypothetical protein